MVNNKNILVIKHGSTGDIFMSFNALKSILNYSPNITICSTKTGLKTFRLLNSHFNEIIDERGKIIQTLKVLLKIKKKRFDYIIDLQNSTRTSIYLLFIKLFTKAQSNGTSIFSSKRYKSQNYKEHVIIGLNKQIQLLNIQKIQNKIYHPLKKFNQVIIVPGSSKSGQSKRWPFESYLKVIDYLISKKIKCYIIGGNDEKEIGKMIPKNKYIINLINNSPWDYVKKIALKSKVTISNDTSAMHFISNLNLPVIAIMKDNIYSFRNNPLSDNSIIIKNKNIKNIPAKKVIKALSKYV
tara:strand:+ start:388 stop:1275 length:888 start_codon:yes stop_codon:yes gene_type:complete